MKRNSFGLLVLIIIIATIFVLSSCDRRNDYKVSYIRYKAGQAIKCQMVIKAENKADVVQLTKDATFVGCDSIQIVSMNLIR